MHTAKKFKIFECKIEKDDYLRKAISIKEIGFKINS